MSSAPEVGLSAFQVMRNQLLGDAALYAAVRLVNGLATLFVIVILSRLLGPSDLGTYTLLVQAATLAAGVWFGTIGTAGYRELPAHRERGTHVQLKALIARTYFVLALVLAGIVGVSWRLGAASIGSLPGAVVIGWVVVLASFGPASSFADLNRIDGRSRAFSITSLAVYSLPLSLLLVLWALDAVELRTAMAAQAIPAVLVFIGLGVAWGRKPTFAPSLSREVLRGLIRFGLPLAGALAASWALSVSDRFLLAAFRSTAEVGVYTLGYQIASAPLLFAFSAAVAALEPLAISAHESAGRERAASIIGKTFCLVLAACVLLSISLTIVAPAFLGSVVGENYERAAVVVPLVAAGVTLLCLGTVVQQVFGLVRRTSVTFRNLAVAAVGNVVLNAVLIPSLGIEGAAVATLVSYGLFLAVTWASARGLYPLELPVAFIVRTAIAAVASIVAAILVGAWLGSDWPGTIGQLGVAVVVFVACLVPGNWSTLAIVWRRDRAVNGTGVSSSEASE